eukprot:scaffold1975_cov241-Pinguiococcus_pyrenoidosus.AAC.7
MAEWKVLVSGLGYPVASSGWLTCMQKPLSGSESKRRMHGSTRGRLLPGTRPPYTTTVDDDSMKVIE